MNNGSDNHGDDEASVDGSYTSQNDHEMNSDHSQETFSNNENENDITPRNGVEDCMEENPENNESMSNLLKLLPYLYLLQKNYGANGNSSLVPGFELTNSQLCSNFGDFSDTRNFRALLESEQFKNFQQLLPYASGNGMNLTEENGDSEEEDVNCEESSSEHDEPLDLTQKTKIMSKPIREDKSVRPTQRAERGYTIQDLDAALQDIQSGKLGTRRAAVIYGIPRSTLRNKVYKLGKAGTLKSPASYNGTGTHKHGTSGFIRGLNDSKINYPNGEDFETNDDCNGDNILNHHNLVGRNHAILHKNNPYSLLRNDNLTGNGGRMTDGHNLTGEQRHTVGERNQLLFMGGVSDGHHNQRGRHGPCYSLPTFRPSSGPSGYENFSDSSSLGKKSRPKRGKYRNYDRDALTKAVQAVQNGEMSVHRAGSYFGVPHSTLEYKVKERHLLRQAKFKGKQSQSTAGSSPPKPGVVVNEQTASYNLSSVTPLLSPSSPTAGSNDSSTFQKTFPDMEKSLRQFMRSGLLSSVVASASVSGEEQNQTKWIMDRSPLVGLGGLVNASGDGDADVGENCRKEINAPLPKIYEPNETLENNPSDLLDLTRKQQQQKA